MKLTRNILVIDDETRWLRTINMVLSRHIPEACTHTCENSRQALQLIADLDIALVLLDLNMPLLDGHQLLRDIRDHAPYVRIIVVTGLNDTEVAVECMKQGAYDFIAKTSSTEQLLLCVRRAMEVIGLERNYHRIKDGFFNRKSLRAFDPLLTTDIKMHDCFTYAASLSESCGPILLEGETGTGKRLFAKSLHQLLCPNEPILELSLLGITVSELEEKLFGNMTQTGFLHAANAGVLLLTDVSEASEPVQITLTRLCQFKRYFPIGSLREKSFKCRLLFTSQQTLEQLEIKSFYLGLLYLLRPQRISLPPLRDRKNDIGLLLIHFTEQACQRLEREYLSAPVELIEKLEPYDFPGNITELKSLVFSAVHISYGNELSVTPFLQALKQSSPSQVKQNIKFPETLPTINDLVQKLIHEALVRTNNNQSAAAKLLGITQSALSRRLSKSE